MLTPAQNPRGLARRIFTIQSYPKLFDIPRRARNPGCASGASAFPEFASHFPPSQLQPARDKKWTSYCAGENMRVGLVSYEYPPQQGLGGVGTYMFRLAGALGRAGHEVHVITGPSDRPPVQQPNVSLHRIPAAYEMGQSSRALRWLYWTVMAKPMSRINPTIWHWLKWDLASADAI